MAVDKATLVNRNTGEYLEFEYHKAKRKNDGTRKFVKLYYNLAASLPSFSSGQITVISYIMTHIRHGMDTIELSWPKVEAWCLKQKHSLSKSGYYKALKALEKEEWIRSEENVYRVLDGLRVGK